MYMCVGAGLSNQPTSQSRARPQGYTHHGAGEGAALGEGGGVRAWPLRRGLHAPEGQLTEEDWGDDGGGGVVVGGLVVLDHVFGNARPAAPTTYARDLFPPPLHADGYTTTIPVKIAPEEVSMWIRSCSKPMTTDQKGDSSTSVASVAKAGCVRMVRLTASYTCLGVVGKG